MHVDPDRRVRRRVFAQRPVLTWLAPALIDVCASTPRIAALIPDETRAVVLPWPCVRALCKTCIAVVLFPTARIDHRMAVEAVKA